MNNRVYYSKNIIKTGIVNSTLYNVGQMAEKSPSPEKKEKNILQWMAIGAIALFGLGIFFDN